MGVSPSKIMIAHIEQMHECFELDYLHNVVLADQEKICLPCKTEWAPYLHAVNRAYQTSTPQSTIITAPVRVHAAPSPFTRCARRDVYQYHKIN